LNGGDKFAATKVMIAALSAHLDDGASMMDWFE
jgi:hypothetical protein